MMENTNQTDKRDARYLCTIQINKLYHLSDRKIELGDAQHPHLIVTGKNGSGKTVLLNAVSDYLEKVKDDTNFYNGQYRSWLKNAQNSLAQAVDEESKAKAEMKVAELQKRMDDMFGRVELTFDNLPWIVNQYQKGEFVLAFYAANRKVSMNQPTSPVKPVLVEKPKMKDSSTREFLNFMVDLKFREALARNENQLDAADQIKTWFADFEGLLQKIFQEPSLTLKFDIVDYSFHIVIGDKAFTFNEMSDGFAAVLDIVVDLILKMQRKQSLTGVYLTPGIVLIDEIETHLHLELQRMVLPLLIRVFPRIQFVVTTHSPFVLNSIDSVVAYDMECGKRIENLTEYSYESLAEGYFGVKSESSYMEMQLEQLQHLLVKDNLSISDIEESRSLLKSFETLSEVASPTIVGAFRQLVIENFETVRKIKGYDQSCKE